SKRFLITVGGSVTTGKCLDVAGGNGELHSKIQLFRCHGKESQQFEFHPDDTIRIMGKCLDIPDAKAYDHQSVQLFHCNPSQENQRFVRDQQNRIHVMELVKHSLIHCRIITTILNSTLILCLWTGAFVSIERVLIQLFKYSLYRSRKNAIIISVSLILLTTAANITTFIGWKSAVHPIVLNMRLCKFRQFPPHWKLVDEIVNRFFTYIYPSNVYMNRFRETWTIRRSRAVLTALFGHHQSRTSRMIEQVQLSVDDMNLN
ncbi:unnamed protein product, partial [Rotaria sp. Silwood1]